MFCWEHFDRHRPPKQPYRPRKQPPGNSALQWHCPPVGQCAPPYHEKMVKNDPRRWSDPQKSPDPNPSSICGMWRIKLDPWRPQPTGPKGSTACVLMPDTTGQPRRSGVYISVSVTELETVKVCRCSHSVTLQQCGCLLTLLLKSRFSCCLFNHLVVDAQNARQASSGEGQATEGVLLFIIQAVICFWSLYSF